MYFHSLQNGTEKLDRGWLFFLFLKLAQIKFIFADKALYCLYNSYSVRETHF